MTFDTRIHIHSFLQSVYLLLAIVKMHLVMDKIRLLIIEEHLAVRKALQTRLQSSTNLEVVAAHQYVADWQPPQNESVPANKIADVVLLGLKSSGQRHFNLAIQEIQKFRQLGIAVIVLVSFANDVERDSILRAGAQRYLLKDINSIQLIAEIEALAAARAG